MNNRKKEKSALLPNNIKLSAEQTDSLLSDSSLWLHMFYPTVETKHNCASDDTPQITYQ